MKYRLLLVIFVFFINMVCYGQIKITKFKFTKDSPFGCCPTRKGTDIAFNVEGSKSIKYIKIRYSGVNQVNDAVSSDIVGAVNANQKHCKYRDVLLTGPFEFGKKYKRWLSASFYYPLKIIAFPLWIEITYMDKEIDTINLTKQNISTYFPTLTCIDVNYNDGN